MEFLTEKEREVIKKAGEIWKDILEIVGDDISREADIKELIQPIHALQRNIMAQAAARAYPDEFRLLGGVIRDGSRAETAPTEGG